MSFVTQYRVEFINRLNDACVTHVETFSEIQARSIDAALNGRSLYIDDAQKLIDNWNRSARGEYIYSLEV